MSSELQDRVYAAAAKIRDALHALRHLTEPAVAMAWTVAEVRAQTAVALEATHDPAAANLVLPYLVISAGIELVEASGLDREPNLMAISEEDPRVPLHPWYIPGLPKLPRPPSAATNTTLKIKVRALPKRKGEENDGGDEPEPKKARRARRSKVVIPAVENPAGLTTEDDEDEPRASQSVQKKKGEPRRSKPAKPKAAVVKSGAAIEAGNDEDEPQASQPAQQKKKGASQPVKPSAAVVDAGLETEPEKASKPRTGRAPAATKANKGKGKAKALSKRDEVGAVRLAGEERLEGERCVRCILEGRVCVGRAMKDACASCASGKHKCQALKDSGVAKAIVPAAGTSMQGTQSGRPYVLLTPAHLTPGLAPALNATAHKALGTVEALRSEVQGLRTANNALAAANESLRGYVINLGSSVRSMDQILRDLVPGAAALLPALPAANRGWQITHSPAPPRTPTPPRAHSPVPPRTAATPRLDSPPSGKSAPGWGDWTPSPQRRCGTGPPSPVSSWPWRVTPQPPSPRPLSPRPPSPRLPSPRPPSPRPPSPRHPSARPPSPRPHSPARPVTPVEPACTPPPPPPMDPPPVPVVSPRRPPPTTPASPPAMGLGASQSPAPRAPVDQ